MRNTGRGVSIFEVRTTPVYERMYRGVVSKNKYLIKKIDKAVYLLSWDPYYPSLKTHDVYTKNFGRRKSSRVTGDIRIIWDFIEDKTVILAITIGGHEGGNKAYR